MKYLIALDAGTTSVRAFVYDLAEKKFVYPIRFLCVTNVQSKNFVELTKKI